MSEHEEDPSPPVEQVHPLGGAPAGAAANPAHTAGHAPARRALPRSLALTAAVAVTVLLAASGGAVVGHELWSSSSPGRLAASAGLTPGGLPFAGSPFRGGFSGAPPGFGGFGFGSDGGNGAGGTAPANSGAPADSAAVAAKVDPAIVDVSVNLGYQGAQAAGTGIVLSSSGEVLTNNHVIHGATTISVTDVGNGRTYPATVVGYDPSHDIAVLELEGASGLQTATLGDSSKASVGEGVIGIGNAGGSGGTPTSAGGSITALDQSITAADQFAGAAEQLSGLIEVNAAVQSGDSGGPLVDSQGRVIGMDTAGSSGFVLSSTDNQAYAIPIDEALATASQIEAGHGSATIHVGPTAFLGVTVASPGLGAGLGAGVGAFGGAGSAGRSGSTSPGVTVSGVLAGQPAQKAGLAAGDLITAVDGHSVGSGAALTSLLLAHHPGDSIRIAWSDSSGGRHSATVALSSGPAA